jgi:hypothetical protein
MSFLIIGLALFFTMVVLSAIKQYPGAKAERTMKKIFKKYINYFDFKAYRDMFNAIGFKILETQAGISMPNTNYLKYQKIFMDSLTETDKLEFVNNVLSTKFTAKHLLQISNGWGTTANEFVYVVGLFALPEEKKENFQSILKEFLVMKSEDTEKRNKRYDRYSDSTKSKSFITNIGYCPKCLREISMLAKKCPYCTADL